MQTKTYTAPKTSSSFRPNPFDGINSRLAPIIFHKYPFGTYPNGNAKDSMTYYQKKANDPDWDILDFERQVVLEFERFARCLQSKLNGSHATNPITSIQIYLNNHDEKERIKQGAISQYSHAGFASPNFLCALNVRGKEPIKDFSREYDPETQAFFNQHLDTWMAIIQQARR